MVTSELIKKYDVAAPRYTSYPAVPHWDKSIPAQESWKRNALDAWMESEEGIALYIHLPFCESLCTYCACNTRITKNHAVEEPYIEYLLKEWAMYLDLFGTSPRINELHLGGGTPTFFSPKNLSLLIEGLASSSVFARHAALSFEAHPANTTSSHLEAMYKAGFRRISLGIQDFDPAVQKLVHRKQSVEQVKAITNLARILGYTSINFDLIYGLPAQTIESVKNTIRKVISIRPDRIAFYSYAHVPWMKPGQRAYSEKDLPTGEMKRALYDEGRKLLEEAGYVEIGLDHFALPGDELLVSLQNGKLHRNFMGYTTSNAALLVGLGVSAISDSGTMFVQNEKSVEQWKEIIDKGKFPFFRGHELSPNDMVLRDHILNLMCAGETSWMKTQQLPKDMEKILKRLQPLVKDGLVEVGNSSVKATEDGRRFLRNIGACFDEKLNEQRDHEEQVFSQTT